MDGYNMDAYDPFLHYDIKPYTPDSMEYEVEKSYTVSDTSDSLFVNDNEDDVPFCHTQERAKQANGEPFSTICNEYPHIKHPHHHRLNCGHDIVTDKIEACGNNCAVQSYEHAQKPFNSAFNCPHPSCMRGTTILFAKKKVGGRVIQTGRECTLSHVYGKDKKADEMRRQEKESEFLNAFATTDIRTGRSSNQMQEGLRRKRSQSPNSRRPIARKPAPIEVPKRLPLVDEDSAVSWNFMLDAEGNQIVRQALLDMSKEEKVDTPTGIYFKTKAQKQEELANDKAAADFEKMDFDTPQERQEKFRQKRKQQVEAEIEEEKKAANGMHTAQGPAQQREGEDFLCNVCDQWLDGSSMRCLDCEDFDMCLTCHDSQLEKHNIAHRLRIIEGFDSEGLPARFAYHKVNVVCDCQDLDTKFLVLCGECDKVAFHPGCCGRGQYPRAEYVQFDIVREQYRKEDWQKWLSESTQHLCNVCFQDKENAASLGDKKACAEPTPILTRRQAIKRLAHLRKEVNRLSARLSDAENKQIHQEMLAADSDVDKIAVMQTWFAYLSGKDFEETLYEQEVDKEFGFEPIKKVPEWKKPQPAPAWKKASKRKADDVDEEDGVCITSDAQEEITDSPRNKKRVRFAPLPKRAAKGMTASLLNSMSAVSLTLPTSKPIASKPTTSAPTAEITYGEGDDAYEPQDIEMTYGEGDDEYEPTEQLPQVQTFTGIPGIAVALSSTILPIWPSQGQRASR